MIYEIYFDKSKDLTNDNFSWFIKADKKPTPREARKILHNAGKDLCYGEGYHVTFISESNWDYNDIKDDIVEIA